jgi:hypothetical protein
VLKEARNIYPGLEDALSFFGTKVYFFLAALGA